MLTSAPMLIAWVWQHQNTVMLQNIKLLIAIYWIIGFFFNIDEIYWGVSFYHFICKSRLIPWKFQTVSIRWSYIVANYRKDMIWEDNYCSPVESFSPIIQKLNLPTWSVLSWMSSECSFIDGPYKRHRLERFLHKTVKVKSFMLIESQITSRIN